MRDYAIKDPDVIRGKIADAERELANARGRQSRDKARSRLRYWTARLAGQPTRAGMAAKCGIEDVDPANYAPRQVGRDPRWYLGTDANPCRFGPWPLKRQAEDFLPLVPWALRNARPDREATAERSACASPQQTAQGGANEHGR
jgi:hypothetical protein